MTRLLAGLLLARILLLLACALAGLPGLLRLARVLLLLACSLSALPGLLGLARLLLLLAGILVAGLSAVLPLVHHLPLE
ncbi:hypothetical protein [Variovorax sp. RA8]|uniref:hypothetical protein n=1 Tax=Variovorax sp. (strain JCM 16519 / RA8) TaxID=662548 RepID=UPI000AF4A94D|nr:hypothetical protein [Variovorax sp. RA8]